MERIIYSILCLALLLPSNSMASESLYNAPYEINRPYVVLIPGAGASGGKLAVENLTRLLEITGHGEYFSGYKGMLSARKIPFMLCPQTEDQDRRALIVRASECIQQIFKLTQSHPPSRNILIIGHSMGGNIARITASSPLISSRIKAVLTISTPHSGTTLADFVLDHYDSEKGILDPAYKAVMEFIGFTPGKKKYINELVTEKKGPGALYVAQTIPNAPKVKYFSISNFTKISLVPPLNLTKKILADEMRTRNQDTGSEGVKNDGVVPTQFMIWGNHLAQIEADHWEGLCIGILEKTLGCKKMRKILGDFLDDYKTQFNN